MQHNRTLIYITCEYNLRIIIVAIATSQNMLAASTPWSYERHICTRLHACNHEIVMVRAVQPGYRNHKRRYFPGNGPEHQTKSSGTLRGPYPKRKYTVYKNIQFETTGPPWTSIPTSSTPQLLKFSSSLAVSGKVSCLAALKTSCWDAIHKEAEAFRMDHIAVQQGAKMALKSTGKCPPTKRSNESSLMTKKLDYERKSCER